MLNWGDGRVGRSQLKKNLDQEKERRRSASSINFFFHGPAQNGSLKIV